MTPPFVLALSGSPSPGSRTALLADAVLRRVAAAGAEVDHLRARDLEPAALLAGDAGEPSVARLAAMVARADGIVVATPIFKSAASGLLKAALDVLPQYGLAGKAVLPVATGGSLAHALALDYALRPILQSMGARHIVQSFFLCERDLPAGDPATAMAGLSHPLLDAAIGDFARALNLTPAASGSVSSGMDGGVSPAA